jgi:uncharacterized DUF497 family protein
VVKPKNILSNCTGFEWDEGNLTKNWEKHEVSEAECEQIFFRKPLIIKHDKKHAQLENRYYALGRTDADRLLFAAFTVRRNKIRIISARDMTRTEKRRYEK